MKLRIGQGLNTWYTVKATSGLRMQITPTIYGVGGDKTALVTVVCTCILGTQLPDPDPDALATFFPLSPWRVPKPINSIKTRQSGLKRLTLCTG